MAALILWTASALWLGMSHHEASAVAVELFAMAGMMLLLIAVIAKVTQYAPMYRCVTCGGEARCRPGQTVCGQCKALAERDPATIRQ